MNSNKKITLRTLVESDKSLLLISFIFAVIVWFSVSLYASPSKEGTVTVPITIDMSSSIISQNNYQVFGNYVQSVDIGVTGPTYLVNALSADDFEVIAKTNNVDGSGEFNLKVVVNVKKNEDEISVISQSLDTITVYFDSNETKKYEIEIDDTLIKDSISSDCILNSITPLTAEVEIVGPKSELEKIKRVVCTPESDQEIDKTLTVDCDVKFEGYESGDNITVSDFVTYEKTVKIKVDIWKSARIPARVVLLNNSDNFTATVSPEYVDVIIDTEIIDSKEYIDIGSVDCTDIESGDSQIINADDITLDSSFKLKDNDSSYTVTFYSDR